MVNEVIKYVTNDGEEFVTYLEAIAHEEELDFINGFDGITDIGPGGAKKVYDKLEEVVNFFLARGYYSCTGRNRSE